MIDFAQNIKLNFGAKYVAEDTASYILYKFDRASLNGGAVSMERFARFLGLEIMCEYITGDCTEILGTAVFEPQRIYLRCGFADCVAPSAIVERDVIESGNGALYNFTLAILCAEYLFYRVKNGEQENGQLSFGLESVESERNVSADINSAFALIEAEEGAASFALKLLLPKNGFKRQVAELYAQFGVNRATVDGERHLPAVLESLAERYNAPEAAVAARLKELNLY